MNDYFKPKNRVMLTYFERLYRDSHVELPPSVARQLGRTSLFRENRGHILIAEDVKTRISIIKIRDPLRLKRNSNGGFYF